MAVKQQAFLEERGVGAFTQASTVQSLYTQHNNWLIGWLCMRLGCPNNAADLAQDTFVRVLTRKEVTVVHEPRAWLLTIAKRLLIDKHRRYQLEQAYLAELKLSSESMAHVPSSEQLLLAVQTLELLTQALEQLADKPKRAFLLRHTDGLTHAAIAEQLDVTVTMVRKYLVQGLVACHNVVEDIQQ